MIVATWTKTHPKQHGYCSLVYLNMRTKEVTTHELQLAGKSTVMNLGRTEIDFMEGKIFCAKTEDDFLHKLVISFVVSTLYLMIEPVPLQMLEMEDDQELPQELKINSQCEMLLAAGTGTFFIGITLCLKSSSNVQVGILVKNGKTFQASTT